MHIGGKAIIGGVGLTIVIFGISLLQQGQRATTTIESIRGVPYFQEKSVTHITEALAHTDVILHEPVAAKNLTLTTTFIPHNTKEIWVGVRQDPFWLSYIPTKIYEQKNQKEVHEPITATVTIPLTDKLQDTNSSIDLMFFADTTPADIVSGASQIYEDPTTDRTKWDMISLSAHVTPYNPSWTEWKAYIKSVIRAERPE